MIPRAFLPPAGLLAAALLLSGCTNEPIVMMQASQHTVQAEPGWEPPVVIKKWEYIIVHHSATHAGGARCFDRYHRKVRRWENGLGYHFVIGNGTDTYDGQVEVGHRWLKQITGAHVGGKNNIGKIGICLVGNFDREKPTTRQMNSLRRLIEFLQVRCGIPASRVRGHCEVVRPGYTHCPGCNFSMDQLRGSILRDPPPYNSANVVFCK
jgi:hypothetical protein